MKNELEIGRLAGRATPWFATVRTPRGYVTGWGRTRLEAVGSLIFTHGAALGIRLRIDEKSRGLPQLEGGRR